MYCDQFVGLYVCVCDVDVSVRKHNSGTAGPIFTKYVQIPCGRGSVFLWWCCDTLRTSSFMDDVTVGCSGPYGNAWLAALWYRGGVWCLWMLCFYMHYIFRISWSGSSIKVIGQGQGHKSITKYTFAGGWKDGKTVLLQITLNSHILITVCNYLVVRGI